MTQPRQKRIALTGSRGLVGGELSHRLREGFEVTAFSRKSSDRFEPLERLLDPEVLGAQDFLLHLAWSHLPVTAGAGDTGAAEDFVWLCRLLDGLAALPDRLRPTLVFFSTGAVYGNAPETSPGFTETDPVRPLGAYAAGKREAERLIERYAQAAGLPALILRVSNLYGAIPQSGRPQGIVPKLIAAAHAGETFSLWGIDAKKDYLHLEDFEAALRAVFERSLTGTFNVSFGRSWLTTEVIASVEAVTGRPVQLVREEPKSWDVAHSVLSRDKFSEETGWEPRIGLREGIERFQARWLREAQQG